MITKKITLSLLAFFLVATLTGCRADAPEAEAAKPAIPVKVGHVVQELVEETYVTIGEVIPNNQFDVYLNPPGEIEAIFVKPGDFIEKDMPMIQLSNPATKTSFNATESQLRTIRDNLSVQYNAALESYNLLKLLFDSGTISEKSLSDSHDQLLIAKRQYQDANTNYQNQISNLRSSVEDLLVQSPILGQVASLNVKVGETAGNQLAVTIIDNSTLYVKTMVPGELKKTLTLNQDVHLSVEGIDHIVPGKINTINEIPDLSSKLFEVDVEILEDVNIGVGDFSEVEFVTKSYQALLVPSTAIVRKGIEKYLFTYDNEQLEKVVLETGLSKGQWIEVITEELSPASTIIVRGQNDLREDDVITVIE